MQNLLERASSLPAQGRVEEPEFFVSPGKPCRVRLNLNENPEPFPDKVAGAILENLHPAGFRTYFDTFCERLQKALSAYSGFPAETLAIGNGGDDLIHTLLYLAASSGSDAAVTLDPSYYYYAPAVSCHALEHLRVPLDRNLTFDPELFVKLVNGGPGRIAFLCNPNNPTGHLLPTDAVRFIMDRVDAGSLLVIDEAYWDYSGVTFAGEAIVRPNVLILRTMSKMFSFAGVHFGYLIGSPALIRAIESIRNPYTVNFLTQTAAAVTLEMSGCFEGPRDELKATRDWFADQVRALGLQVFPSATNFLLIGPAPCPDGPGVSIHEALFDAGFLTRPLAGEFAGCTRVTIGSRQIMSGVLETIRCIVVRSCDGRKES